MKSYEEFVEELRALIKKREATCDEYDYGIECIWKQWIELCCEHMDYLIRFLDEDSTGDEYAWLSEVYEEIASIEPNKEYIACLYRAAQKYPKDTEYYNVMSFIVTAEAIVKTRLDDDSDSEE